MGFVATDGAARCATQRLFADHRGAGNAVADATIAAGEKGQGQAQNTAAEHRERGNSQSGLSIAVGAELILGEEYKRRTGDADEDGREGPHKGAADSRDGVGLVRHRAESHEGFSGCCTGESLEHHVHQQPEQYRKQYRSGRIAGIGEEHLTVV